MTVIVEMPCDRDTVTSESLDAQHPRCAIQL